MKKSSGVFAIFKEFINRYPRHFGVVFVLLVIEGITAALSLLAIIPMIDFLIDPSLQKPSKITRVVVSGFESAGWSVTFWKLGALFILFNLLKGLLEVVTRYSIFKIKYAVIRGLFNETLAAFFKARWGFFSGEDNGRLLNTMNKELTVIGDTLGHLALLLAQIIQV
ncbi:MAG: hypothetical protein ABI581_03590, partial [Sediminibacterium sp.]